MGGDFFEQWGFEWRINYQRSTKRALQACVRLLISFSEPISEKGQNETRLNYGLSRPRVTGINTEWRYTYTWRNETKEKKIHELITNECFAVCLFSKTKFASRLILALASSKNGLFLKMERVKENPERSSWKRGIEEDGASLFEKPIWGRMLMKRSHLYLSTFISGTNLYLIVSMIFSHPIEGERARKLYERKGFFDSRSLSLSSSSILFSLAVKWTLKTNQAL